MKNYSTFFLCLGVFLGLFSCETKKSFTHNYYPVDSLIQAQIEFLKESKAILTKKAEVNGTEETSTFAPKDSAAWAHELDIFAELNAMNSPVNVGNYTIENGLKDSTSNLSVRLITGKSKLPIVYVKIFYLETV